MKKMYVSFGLASILLASSAFAAVEKHNPYRHQSHASDTSVQAGVVFYDIDDIGSEKGLFVKLKHGAKNSIGVEVEAEGFGVDNSDLDVNQYRVAANYVYGLSSYGVYVRPSVGLVYTDLDVSSDTGASVEVAVGNTNLYHNMNLELAVRYDDYKHTSLSDELLLGLELTYKVDHDVYALVSVKDTRFGSAIYAGLGVNL